MKITICGSIAFYDQMLDVQKKLTDFGHAVKIPPAERSYGDSGIISSREFYDIRHAAKNDDRRIWEIKKQGIREHFEKIDWCEAIIVLNYDKKGIANYIGGNTLMEMGLAFYQNKPIYLLQPLPEISYKEEILGMFPIIINGDLKKIG
ncbi:MAG TPA: hypothetical protein VMC41_04505 [Candidatus Nanoarchaeia archaeon]|nr:hypothetical protein [Candidatus Nanoarchaeia archaeon]